MSLFRRAGALIARFFNSAADPAAAAGEFQLYSKDDGGSSQLFGRSDDGTVHQITPGANLANSALGFFGTGRQGTVTFDGVATVLGMAPNVANLGGIGTVTYYALSQDPPPPPPPHASS